MKKILPLFSYLLHPIFTPLFGVFAYLLLNENYFELVQKYLIIAQVSIITIFIPICFFFLLKTIGKADSVMVSEVSQRKLPLLIQSALLAILIRQSITMVAIPELFFFFLGGLCSGIFAFVLLFANLKVSLHMIGVSAMTVFVVGLSIHNQVNAIYLISFLVLMNGVVAASRLQMQAHSAKELVLGTFSGVVPALLLWHFWL